jgi:catechol 2,3-dioxygenase-like lactoylglutathione lyase family enzyme
MNPMYIEVVSVPVSDQDRAKAFYADTLGFEVVSDHPMGEGMRWVQLRPPNSATSITLVSWFDAMPPGSLKGTVLATDDINATYQQLEGRGLRWNGPVEEQFWGSFATFDDPDGNGWVVAQSTHGA